MSDGGAPAGSAPRSPAEPTLSPARRRLAAFLAPAVGIVLCTGVGLAAGLPAPAASDVAAVAARFAFEPALLDSSPPGAASVRTVEPELAHISSWISAVGASVGLGDISGNGRPDDYCLVDPRYDSVTVGPVPGTGHRYAPFRLAPAGLRYDSTMAPMGCVIADLNEDGLTDVLVYYWGRSPVIFLHRAGVPMGPAAFRAVELVSPPPVWNTEAVDVVDLSGDGHPDVVVGNYFPDGARVLDPAARYDPFMQMPDSLSNAQNGGGDEIFAWLGGTGGADPTVRYRDASAALPPDTRHSWTLAIGAQDLTGDGLPDLYIANDFGPARLLVNHSSSGRIRFGEAVGQRGFTVPKSQVLGFGSFKGMGVAFADLTGSGQPDIVSSNITEAYALEESNFAFVPTVPRSEMAARLDAGVAPYVNESETLGLSRGGWAWDVQTGDFDDSGQLEIVQATGFVKGTVNQWAELQQVAMGNDNLVSDPATWPNFTPGTELSGSDQPNFWVRDGSGYVDVASELHLQNPGVTRAVATADVWGDGRLDFALADQWAPSVFYRNVGSTHPYVGLQLVVPAVDGPPGAVTTALGAEATLVRPDGVQLTRQVFPANGHGSTSMTGLLFGLGSSPPGPVRVELRWRDAAGLHTASIAVGRGWHTVLLQDGRVAWVRAGEDG